jgi:hypothetical protein
MIADIVNQPCIGCCVADFAEPLLSFNDFVNNERPLLESNPLMLWDWWEIDSISVGYYQLWLKVAAELHRGPVSRWSRFAPSVMIVRNDHYAAVPNFNFDPIELYRLGRTGDVVRGLCRVLIVTHLAFVPARSAHFCPGALRAIWGALQRHRWLGLLVMRRFLGAAMRSDEVTESVTDDFGLTNVELVRDFANSGLLGYGTTGDKELFVFAHLSASSPNGALTIGVWLLSHAVLPLCERLANLPRLPLYRAEVVLADLNSVYDALGYLGQTLDRELDEMALEEVS